MKIQKIAVEYITCQVSVFKACEVIKKSSSFKYEIRSKHGQRKEY